MTNRATRSVLFSGLAAVLMMWGVSSGVASDTEVNPQAVMKKIWQDTICDSTGTCQYSIQADANLNFGKLYRQQVDPEKQLKGEQYTQELDKLWQETPKKVVQPVAVSPELSARLKAAAQKNAETAKIEQPTKTWGQTLTLGFSDYLFGGNKKTDQ